MKHKTICIFLFLVVSMILPQALQAQIFTVSGRIVDSQTEAGVDGVTITFFDGLTTETEITVDGGYYSHTVAAGWRGTVTPSQSGYAFTPAVSALTPVAQNETRNFSRYVPATISGSVTEAGGEGGETLPVPGVLLTLSTGQTTTTNEDGFYSITLASGWSGSITPSKGGYTFSPVSRPYSNLTGDQTGQDYTASPSAVTYTISGTVDDGASALAGVTVSLSTGESTTTNGSGVYTIDVGTGWSGTITPSMAGYTFSPVFTALINVTSDQPGQDFTGTPGSQFTISGQVTVDGRDGVDGVTITFDNGETTQTATTAGGGYYSQVVPSNWSGTVTPSLSPYAFSPASPTVGPVQSNTVQDFDAIPPTYTISGTISEAGGEQGAIEGVTVTLSTGETTTTGSSGDYAVTVNWGWSGTITPSLPNWIFDPTQRNLSDVTSNVPGQDFLGTHILIQYTISGFVTERGSGIANVIMNGLPGLPITDSSGYYSAVVNAGWSGTVTPFRAGYVFTPLNRTYTAVAGNMNGENYASSSGNPVISGTITKTAGGSAISGVTITFSNGGGAATADAAGNYAQTVPSGWSGIATPSKGGWSFEPVQRAYNNVTVDQANQNYAGTVELPQRTLSGTVMQNDGTGIPGVTMNFSNEGGTAITDSNGEYSMEVTYGWSGTVTPYMAGYTFVPPSRSYSSIKVDLPYQDFISTGAPGISLSRSNLAFAASEFGASGGPQTFMVSNSGGGTLNWTASTDQSWLACTPSSGTGSGMVTVSVDAAGLAAGTYMGAVSVSDASAPNSPQAVSVTLTVYGAASSTPPFGSFSTPIDGSTVQGSIPVTGWALDDIGVDNVKIYLADGGMLDYIGDAVFIAGARPDVEILYPGYPNNSSAGWGYMMLTHFLPDGGNGTYTFHAVAEDVEGNIVTLGTKTVTCDNANAVKPFGAIDTPEQGGEASGASYRNQGWVLTPQPNSIPTDGSTIDVYVDGVNLGNPAYNYYREDIAALFPGYANSSGAYAFFDLDTTAYANGVHTIYWMATDDAGNTDGIGSRFFTIMNTGDAPRAQLTAETGCTGQTGLIDFGGTPGVIKGFNRDAVPPEMYFDENGSAAIEIQRMERVEIHLGQLPVGDCYYNGWLLVGNDRRPLPVGSTLDGAQGIFYWLPPQGFSGDFRLLFQLKGSKGVINQKRVTVTIKNQ